ncbi:MAG: DUF58 domain-containing protein [Paenibacillaceae bacterium]
MVSIVRGWFSSTSTMKYSAKFWYFFACVFICTCFMLFQGGKLAFMLFFIMVILSVYLWLGKWSGINQTTGNRVLLNLNKNMSIEAGTSIAVQINLTIPGFWPIPYVMLRDRLVRRNGSELVFETSAVPDWKRRGSVEYITKPLHRGFYHFADVECSTEDIFGLFKHKGSLSLFESFMVKPQTVVIKEWQQFHQSFKGHHYNSTTTRALRETTQINGVREYIYGDRLSRIHWNATAKTGTWKSKEFERESLPKTIIMVDRNRNNYKSKEEFELAVSVAASLMEYGSQKELAMGLLSVGANAVFMEPLRAPSHYRVVNQHLIDIEADGQHPLLHILKDRARNFSQGCFFVVISPQMDDSLLQALHWINHRQMNPCHILIGNPSTSEKPSSSARLGEVEDWLRNLRARGMLAYAVKELHELPVVLGGKNR